MTRSHAYTLFQAAEDAWQAQLAKSLGKRRAAEARYTKLAEGEPGSNLRLLYENRMLAMAQWEALAFDRQPALT